MINIWVAILQRHIVGSFFQRSHKNWKRATSFSSLPPCERLTNVSCGFSITEQLTIHVDFSAATWRRWWWCEWSPLATMTSRHDHTLGMVIALETWEDWNHHYTDAPAGTLYLTKHGNCLMTKILASSNWSFSATIKWYLVFSHDLVINTAIQDFIFSPESGISFGRQGQKQKFKGIWIS